MKKVLIVIFIIVLLVLCGYFVFRNTNDNIQDERQNTVIDSVISNERELEPRTVENSEDITEITFNENEYLAIGFINKDKENEFVKKYFADRNIYDSLHVVDAGSGYKFVIIPKEGVNISVSNFSINEDGSARTYDFYEEELTEPFLLTTDEFENISNVALEIFMGEYGTLMPLSFNELDGRLVFFGNDTSVVDISVY